MNKIYQKSFPGEENASQGRMGGFTLIELLVVVLIIGILAAVALPQYQAVVLRTRYQQAVVAADAVVKAQRLYYIANGSYTKHFNDLDFLLGGGTLTGGGNDNEWLNYSWGSCYMTTVYVNCRIKGTIYEAHYAGTRFCIASGTVSAANRVCRAETASAPVLNVATGYNYYQYE